MKKYIREIIFIVFLILTSSNYAQAPEGFNYQAVIRDGSGEIVSNTDVNLRFSILDELTLGNILYRETQNLTTNEYGMVNHVIGFGNFDLGNFSELNWTIGDKFLKVEVSLNNGAYNDLGTQQLMSVPYALHAKTAKIADTAEMTTGFITESQISDLGNYIETETDPTVKTYSVGEFAQGGVVIWVDETGQHGLVAAIVNQSDGIKWQGGNTNYLVNSRADGIYAGEMNTSIIIAVHAAKEDYDDHAASICAEYQGGGFSDWYLPSIEELNLMYQNKDIINSVVIGNGGGSFNNGIYWSSTEFNFLTSWYVDFSNGNSSFVNVNKINPFSVRAIRSF